MTANYLPTIEWWRQWIASGMPTLKSDEPFARHGAANRCQIDAPNGILTLTIPIQKPATPTSRPTIGDIRISEHGDWRHKHWHALESSYYNSPFFEYYRDDFAPIYFDATDDSLFHFNTRLIRLITQLLNLENLNLAACPPPPPTYYQVFANKHGFTPNLSIVDLLFNMGNETLFHLNSPNPPTISIS